MVDSSELTLAALQNSAQPQRHTVEPEDTGKDQSITADPETTTEPESNRRA